MPPRGGGRTFHHGKWRKESGMETYVILRRNGWRDETEFAGGGERAAAEAERGPDHRLDP